MEKVAGYETRQIIDRDTTKQPTPQVNNAKSTKAKSTLRKKIIFKDAVALPPHSLFRVPSHQIAPDITSNDSNSTGRQGNSNRTIKIFLVTPSIANNNNNAREVGKEVNAMMKVIHSI